MIVTLVKFFVPKQIKTEEMDSSTKIMSSSNIKKLYPSVEECQVNNMVRCTEDGCQSVFTSESNLSLHLTKTHKKSPSYASDSGKKQYYCPEIGCAYNSNNFFKNMKQLRQHYLKNHVNRSFVCNLCQKSFPCENYLKLHKDYCGVDFTCCDCQSSYSCYETLKTHCRRKKHNILNKSEYKFKILASKSEISLTPSNRLSLLLPKPTVSLILFPNVDRTMSNQESQTVHDKPKLKSKMTQVNRNQMSPYNSQQTQTGSQGNHLTVETQTIGDFVSLNQKSDINLSLTQKSSDTQTDVRESKNSSCNTSFNTDFELDGRGIEMSSLSTQTYDSSNIFSTSTMTHDSIYTDTSDLLADSFENDKMDLDNCHMETQTDFMFEDEMFSCDYMSNMYTQTCEEILNDFGFNDIETQTVFDDMLRSVESQTMMSHGKKVNCNLKDMMHMETQTDTNAEFRQLLEVINS
ncbi:hypothetical protein JTB14_027798 [Gonioctena quinquepunctata]|nr:hypothetical protein JTB14_027798 [Gonioctena quinquepunctata]